MQGFLLCHYGARGRQGRGVRCRYDASGAEGSLLSSLILAGVAFFSLKIAPGFLLVKE